MNNPTLASSTSASNYRTFNSSANATVTLNKPSGVADGDLLIAILAVSNDSGQSSGLSSVPSGWTLVGTYQWNGTYAHGIAIYRKTASSEPTSWDFIWQVSGNACGATAFCLRITNGNTTTPTDGFAEAISSGTTGLTFANTITPTLSNDLILLIATGQTSVGTAPSLSSYAIATDNPTWGTPSIVTLYNNTNAYFYLGFNSAVRSAVTATGNFTVTSSISVSNSMGIQLAISRNQTITITETDTQSQSDSATLARTRPFTASDTQSQSDSSSLSTEKTWTYEDKPADTSWTYEDK